MALSGFQIVLMVGMLVTGSINTISKKAQNDCKVEGYPDRSANNTRTVHEFDHPWFQTLIMFFGEMICLGGYCIVRKKERDKRRKEYAEQNKDMTDIPPQPRIVQLVVAVPTICDLVGTSVADV
ncbi:solute f6 carrier family 35 member, partial [Mytilus galloprovincialis]